MVFGVSRFAGGRGAFRRARDVARLKARDRARNGTRMLCATLLVVMCLVMVPGVALAEVAWVTTDDDLYSAYVYDYAYDEFGRQSALAEFVGYNWENMSLSVRNKVLQDATVSMCLDPTNRRCINVAYEWFGDLPVFSQSVNIVMSIFGRERVWQCSMTRAEYEQVQQAMADAVYPNDGSPGEVGHPQAGWHTLPALNIKMPEREGNFNFRAKVYDGLLSSSYTSYGYNAWNTLRGSSTVYWVQDALYNQMVNGTNYEYYLCANSMVYNESTTIYRADAGTTELIVDSDGYTVLTSTNTIYAGEASYQGNYFLNGGVFSKWLESSSAIRIRSAVGKQVTMLGEYVKFAAGEYDTPVGGPPYVPEPDTPNTPPSMDAPTTPDFPTTNAPTTPDSTPTNYVTQPTTVINAPTYNTFPTGTSADYTPWLDEIVSLLRMLNNYAYGIEDDMNTWLYAIDFDIRTGFDNVLARLSSVKAGIHADLVWLGDNLNDWISDAALYLAMYLREVSDYLSDMVSEYELQLQSVINWLRRIYSRMGGTGATKPDPTLDEPGFWDWLIDMFRQFFGGLLGGAADTVGGLFSQLAQLFPFSLPWDLMYILGLLAHEPVTPVFDLPLPVPDAVNSSHRVLVHVDCSAWNGVATAVRAVELIFFAYGLARMVPEWFNTIKVSGM